MSSGPNFTGFAFLRDRFEVHRGEGIGLGAGADLEFDDRDERGVPRQGAELTAAGDPVLEDLADQAGLHVAAALHADLHLTQEAVREDRELFFEGLVEVVRGLAEVGDALAGGRHAGHERFVEAVAETDRGGRDAGAGGLGDAGEDLLLVHEALVGLAIAEEDDAGDAVLAGEGRELLHGLFPAAEEVGGAAGVDALDAADKILAVGHRGERLDDFDVAVEGHDGDAVIGAQSVHDADGAFAGGFEGVAGHRAGAVDDQGEVERGAGGGDDVRRLARRDDADEDVRRFGGGAEEALLQGQDFDLGLAHGRNHPHHHAPIPYTVNIE